MATETIIIGRNYEEIFRAAFKIAKHLSERFDDGTYSIYENDPSTGGPSIEDRKMGYKFCFDSTDPGSARFRGELGDNGEQELGFDYDGATWFKNLRENRASAVAKWEDCTEALRQEFHKNYSIFEHRQKPRKKEEDEMVVARVEAAIRGLFPSLKETEPTITPVTNAQNLYGGSVDIYGMMLRVALGSPEPVHIICRLFFKSEGDGSPQPMLKDDAEELNNMIMNANLSGSEQRREEASELRDKALRALESFINSERAGGYRFKDCIFFTQQQKRNRLVEVGQGEDGKEVTEDEQRLRDLRKSNAHNNSDIECSSIEVLSISHIKWDSAMYDVSYGSNNKAMRIILGLNDSVSLQCLNCGDRELLIDGNKIKVKDDNGAEREIVIDVSKENLGLSAKDLEAIKLHSSFKDHLTSITSGKDSGCRLEKIMRSYPDLVDVSCGVKLRCMSQTSVIDFGDKKEAVCTNCPYAEILFADPTTGEQKATHLMHYFIDTREFSSAKRKQCAICGRNIEVSRNYCDTCAKAVESVAVPKDSLDEAAKKRFRHYRGALPVTVRAVSIGKRRLCFEDDYFLIFVVGKRIYTLNKLDIPAKGYIPAPKRAK